MSSFPELSALHPGHPPRHVPAPAGDLQQARGQAGRPQLRRVLQDLHREPPEEVQAGSQALQGRQGEGKFGISHHYTGSRQCWLVDDIQWRCIS